MMPRVPEGFVEGLVVAGAEKADRMRVVTPTWLRLLPLLLTIYVDGSDEGRAEVLGELQNMALAADCWNRYCNGPRQGSTANG